MYSADEKLVSQTLGGDRDAFGVLVHKYQEMVFTYAFQKVRNEADAQDIMQEIFCRHTVASINSATRISSEAGCIRSCPMSASVSWNASRKTSARNCVGGGHGRSAAD